MGVHVPLRQEETGEHPLDGLYQNAKDLGATTSSSVGDMWNNAFGKKDETPGQDQEAIAI